MKSSKLLTVAAIILVALAAHAQLPQSEIAKRIAKLHYTLPELEKLDYEDAPELLRSKAAALSTEVEPLRPQLEKSSPGLLKKVDVLIKNLEKKASYSQDLREKLQAAHKDIKVAPERAIAARGSQDPYSAQFKCIEELRNNNFGYDGNFGTAGYYYEENDTLYLKTVRKGEPGIYVFNPSGFNFVSLKRARAECSSEVSAGRRMMRIKTQARKSVHSFQFASIWDTDQPRVSVSKHGRQASTFGSDNTNCNLEDVKPLDPDASDALNRALAAAVGEQRQKYDTQVASIPQLVDEAVRRGYSLPEKPNSENVLAALSICRGLGSNEIDKAVEDELKKFNVKEESGNSGSARTTVKP